LSHAAVAVSRRLEIDWIDASFLEHKMELDEKDKIKY
jgi:hypothetical protein